ncbi:Rz1-like lysis system protein LysC [Serratia sp. 509]
MLSACSERPSVVPLAPEILVPRNLLTPCLAPDFNVKTWGDYPDYVARLHLVLAKCNSTITVITELLYPFNETSSEKSNIRESK